MLEKIKQLTSFTKAQLIAKISDVSQIFTNKDGEISALTEKASPVKDDIVLLEDSGSSFAKKKASLLQILSVCKKFGHQSARYYDNSTAATIGTENANVGLSQDILYAVPFLVDNVTSRTFDRIGFYAANQAAGSSAVLGIYQSENGAPGDRLLDAGTVSLTGTGSKEITISQSLDPGYYWLVINLEAALSIKGYGSAESIGRLGTSDLSVFARAGYITRAFTYTGSLPDPFGAVTFDESNNVPRIMLRAA